jgi:hypothetical protein
VYDALSEVLGGLGESERERIFGGNATTVYRLPA